MEANGGGLGLPVLSLAPWIWAANRTHRRSLPALPLHRVNREGSSSWRPKRAGGCGWPRPEGGIKEESGQRWS